VGHGLFRDSQSLLELKDSPTIACRKSELGYQRGIQKRKIALGVSLDEDSLIKVTYTKGRRGER